ncbi:MAG: undecaprenyl-diphosphate phosphatase [Chloroflexi bacterium]|nr:MAG: undecaprenyl-diphosphate phosphatase [Chloroflexota bacterium]TMD79009.1 MAG: undecaprenyl-diphosphate phosphatase [Chloroflexota bacterium]TMF05145.1 MAG: undecaprenyl-diphosphate phosphatase [Chloroflexota bacterium]
MTLLQALFMGLLQGATELFPVSSLGHAVLLPSLLHWSFKQSDSSFLPFLVLLHIGTAIALLILYRAQWVSIIRGFFTAAVRGSITSDSERLAMLLMTGTLPAAVLGVFLESRIKALFASPYAAAAFLIVNGGVMLAAELLRRRAERRASLDGRPREQQEERFTDAAHISFTAAAIVGACQALAFIPGISRSGVTIAGGLVGGLRHTEAARFSFLLATPTILGAGLLEVPLLFARGVPLAEYVLAAVLSGVAAYGSARFLLRYFRSGRLDPYGWYCIGAGLIALALLTFNL